MPDRASPAALHVPLLLGLVAASAVLAGCSQQPPAPENTFEREATVPAGSFFEANLAMNESAEITYDWSTSPEVVLAFDVHSHDGREVRYHDRVNASTHEGSFTAPSQGTFSLLWENTGGEEITVEVTVEGEFGLASVAP